VTSADDGPMPQITDQLRWPVSPILHVLLDAEDQIHVEVLGQRAPVYDRWRLTEAIRQAEAQRRRFTQAAPEAVLAAEIHARAARAGHDSIRQHIAAAAGRQLTDGNGRLAVSDYAQDITEDAMTGIGPLLAQAVTATADEIVRTIPDHAGWRETLALGLRYADNRHAAELYEFAQAVAALPDPDDADVTAGVIADVIRRARRLTAPAPAVISPAGACPAGEPGE
jgi:hypothetical protein